MDKIWEYVSLNAKKALSARRILSLMTFAMGVFHIFLLLFFAFYHIYPLVIVNVFSILLYVLCMWLIKKEKKLLNTFNIIYIEVVVHAAIATLLVGTGSGFMLYLAAMIPLGYYSAYNFDAQNKHVNPMFYVFLSVAGFCFTRTVCNYIEPEYTYGNIWVERLIYMINYFIMVISVVAFCSTLLNQIKLLEKLQLSQNEKLEKLSKIDPLTGLVNRRSIQERYQQSENHKEKYAIILGDIDDFKHVNDTYGHDVGDEVLKAVAEVFKGFVRSGDIVCRWGGEEILIFLPECPKENAEIIAQRILDNVREIEIETASQGKIHVTMTLGVVDSLEAPKFDRVVKIADERLYYGKRSGKNQVVSC